MGGSQPKDELGGQYASFSGGTPGFNWSGVGQAAGQGLTNFGQSQSAPQPLPQFSLGPGISQPTLSAPQIQGAGIPATGQSDETAVFEMLKRLLASASSSGGGYG